MMTITVSTTPGTMDEYIQQNADRVAALQAMTREQLFEMFADAQEIASAWLTEAGAPECVDFLFQNLPTIYAAAMLKDKQIQLEGIEAVCACDTVESTPDLVKQVKASTRLLKRRLR